MDLSMKWADMSQVMREHFLSKACMNTNMAHSEWCDFARWERGYIKEAVDGTHIKLSDEV